MKFNIGDTMFRACAGQRESRITCPDCYGKKYLTVILGNGENVTVDCECYRPGYGQYAGTVSSCDFATEVFEETVNSISAAPAEYNHHPENECFKTREEAEIKAAQLLKEYQEGEKNRLLFLKENASRSWAWNASYHRRELKRAQRQVEHHTTKLDVAKSHMKEEKNENIK